MWWDDTWRRLLDWTNGQGPSERLAAQALASEGFLSIDPTHPLGGPDGGKDAVCTKAGKRWVMAVYFPHGKQRFNTIKAKFSHDLKGVAPNGAEGIAFVTNQQLKDAERDTLKEVAAPILVELFHLDRLTGILDRPEMAGIRRQFLGIGSDGPALVSLGGEGGKSLGAGGGGGGAFGSGALGGAGGPGGGIRWEGQPGKAPGAGGGGAGAIGEGAIGGEGGGGGELVSAIFSVKDLPPTIQIKVGLGGKGGEGDGEDGEDSSFGNFLVAKGGKGGRAGRKGSNTRQVNEDDLARGLRVCAIYLAEVVHFRHGMLDLLSGSWETWDTSNLPVDVQWPLVFTAAMTCVEPHASVEMFAVVTDPAGVEISRQAVVLHRGDASNVALRHGIVSLQFSIATAGIWLTTIESGRNVLSCLPIEVRRIPETVIGIASS